MLKKAKAQFGEAQMEQAKELAQSTLESSHKIWLAGLGAFAKAQKEGTKVFEMLVKEGEALDSQTKALAGSAAGAAREAAMAKAKEMQAMAGGTWDKLQQVFDERVAGAIGRLGIYRAADFKDLAERVNQLSDAVGKLLTKTAGAPAKTRGRAKSAGGVSGTVAGAVKNARRTATSTTNKVIRKAKKVAKAAMS